jgi:NAD(P)-dependent dehydrogenase (short-subunit alcohol dehydrogenase family)
VSSELKGRVAVVTGTSRGIGRAAAEALLGAGAIVFGCSEDSPTDPLRARRYRHLKVDVTVPPEIEALMATVVEEAGHIDILVNNAGGHPPTRAIDDFSVEDFDELVRLNLRSVFVACRAAIPALRKVRGAIVNIGSAVGLYGQEGAVTYCATKAAISGLSKALAIDEAPHGVRVNTICPGAILTPLAKEVHPKERRDKIATWSWMNRWGTAGEVAELVLFLASERSGFITGQDIVIGGGTELGYGFKGRQYYAHMGIEPVAPSPAQKSRAR